MTTKTHRLPFDRSGLHISVKFETDHSCDLVHNPDLTPLVTADLCKYVDGSTQGCVYFVGGVAEAFTRWITPLIESGETVRAQWSSFNRSTGEVEADIYSEFVPDVLLKIAKLKPREMSCHSVSV